MAKNLELPLDFVTERIAFLARTGAGKSGGMRVAFEQFFDAGIFSIFVDPKGDAWGIRGAGIGPGKEILIIGGDHGDIPIEPTTGKVVAEFLMHERVSSVIDISDFSTTEMWRFMADFCKAAYKINRDVCHLFIDEVDMIAGQQYFDPHCLHGIQLIQNKGRNRGWGVTIASQRPQMVNLTVLNASGTYVVMQTIGDDGLKVVKRLLGAVCSKEVTAAIISQLPTLQTREAFVYSPQLLGIDPIKITFNNFQTFDSMRTPRPGETLRNPKSLADIDLSDIQSEMAATIEKVKAQDPEILKAEIDRLKNELKDVAPAEIIVPVFDQENFARTLELIGPWFVDIKTQINKSVDLAGEGVLRLLRTFAEFQATQKILNKELKSVAVAPAPEFNPDGGFDRPLRLARTLPADDSQQITLPTGEYKILTGIAQNPKGITRSQLTLLCRFTKTTISTYLSRLISKGLVIRDGHRLLITSLGRETLGSDAIQALPTGKELRDYWLDNIPIGEAAILRLCIEAYPNDKTKESLCGDTGYTMSSTGTYVSRLITRELLQREGSFYKASPDLFQ